MPDLLPIEALLFGFLLATAVVIARLRDLFAAAMLTGMFSLLSAGLFTLMDAVDVAFTEAAVGAGISTVLMLGTLALTSRQENQQPTRLMPFVIVLLVGAALVWGTLDMPAYGSPGTGPIPAAGNAVIHHRVAPDYIRGTQQDFGLPNIVTAVLGSYRGYDTLGETAVIFTAAVGVLLMLSGPATRRREPAPGENPQADATVQPELDQ
ncbi:MAG: cation:proton antiporter [Rickettsiales bacterium]|nr:cation:proton antiporter [Rickettsiales bacterium]|tara:strand:- start:2408 stop:3031 length:624 start_codon:yes stop_codon:yes gene_type:complete